ncbi:MAG: hypothetical protein ACP5TV_02715 [Anaerolineae bacterium]
MRSRGLLYVGIMVLLLGLFLLFTSVGSLLLGPDSPLGLGRLWPLLLGWAALGFFLPALIWWDRRRQLYGLTFPAVLFLVNCLALLFTSLTGKWSAWAYLWTVEPLGVALGLLALYFFGRRAQALLAAAAAIGAASLVVFAVLVSLLERPAGGLVGAFLLLLTGVLLVIGALVRSRGTAPPA